MTTYIHRTNGRTYSSREPHNPRVGWEKNGIVEERLPVWTQREVENAWMVNDRAVWVRTELLEEVPETHSDYEETEPDPRAEEFVFRLKIQDMAFQVAETLSFNEGNAIIKIVEGQLDVAIAALQRELARRYAPAEPEPEEATNE